MNYEVISAQEFATLPDDPEEKFVALEEICRRNMNVMINDDSNANFDRLISTQYMTVIAAAAQEFGIEGLEYPYNMENPWQELGNFMLKAGGITTRFRLRASRRNPDTSVRLASKTRGRIEQQIQKLRNIVQESDLSTDHQKALLRKLDELSVELSQPRLSFAKVMAILAVVSVGVTGATGFLAEAPQAIVTITSLIGGDKEAEDAEDARLGPPPAQRALPSPPQKLPSPERFGRSNVDDEIPF
ncbi:hypothetical protein [Mesorhizobium sp. M6A.T.Ce.TU.016.01.1.1]|uniref:hypothetical protein n=1 Tax=Mesorhizobium sp. M6A.T.Ce.TU.016.01.1.1 TaxID=2496783 RepID=UPI000FCA9E01|nr:hypothetical protein [Mesorhizobium sp. M6A.T.Ce.TU.016.01.1.1]RUU29509.1 hypothetical protein EOC94_11520 [Mesorhizobium sp. M6A.T.Ce.TU.016.01.1.1]